MVKWVFYMNLPEGFFLFTGAIFAMIEGAIYPISQVVFAQIVAIILDANDAIQIDKWLYGYIGLALLIGFVTTIKSYFLAIAQEWLVFRMRTMAVASIFKQPMTWFDEKRHAKLLLVARLSSDSTNLKSLLGERLANIFQIVGVSVTGLVIAFVSCWRIALVVLACFPLLISLGMVQFKLAKKNNQSKEYEESGKYAAEAIENIRTVVSLGKCTYFLEHYEQDLLIPQRKGCHIALISALSKSANEFCQMGIWSLAFWYGSLLIVQGDCNFTGFFQAFTTISSVASRSAIFLGMIPDATLAYISAQKMYALINGVPPIDKKKVEKPTFSGKVSI